MMIDSIIISRALQQISKLTLPNFGTLLKKENGDIIFSQFLKNDDMVFTSIIMNSYNVSSQEASKLVSEFVLSIVVKITNEGGHFLIPEVGYLYADANHCIKLSKSEPVPVPPQPRQPISPRPIIGISPQPIQQPVVQQQPVMQRPFSQVNPQYRNQPPYGPRPQGLPQRSNPQRPPQRPVNPVQQRPPQPRPVQQRPVTENRRKTTNNNPKRQRTDIYLAISIVVIILIIILICYALFFTSSISDFTEV